MKRAKNGSAKNSLVATAAAGVALSLSVSLILAIVAAIFINNEYCGIESNRLAAVISQFVSAFLGGCLAAGVTDERKNVASMLTGAAFYIVLTVAAMLFFDGLGSGLLSGLISVAAGVICAILLVNRKKMVSKAAKRRGRSR